MLLFITLQILNNPNKNGLIIFVLGILFVLSIYHFLLYFQNKDKVYLYYSLYTVIIFISLLSLVPNGFIAIIVKPYKEKLHFYYYPLLWTYNAIYFIFGFTFINLKFYSPKWYSFIFKTIYLVLITVLVTSLLAGITANKHYIYSVNKLIIPFFFVFGLVCYYVLFKNKNPLKYYIIIGSLVLFISSLIAFYLHTFKIISSESNLNFSVFYIGVIIENIIFSLGLGQKQKHILQEKNESQNKLIQQLEENEQLRTSIQKQLEIKVATISEQAETEKSEKLRVEYDKELIELKMSSLRSQMNPHFIFNSLNAIKLYIIDSDKEKAVYYLNKFSKLIRKILATTREKEIRLVDEIETIKLYIEIENIRFNNEIETTIKIDENLSINTIKIPSLILQPFIENAIWHGLSSKKGIKKIDVIFEKKGKSYLKISIVDNGIGRKKSAEIKSKKILKKESIGIKLTEERLDNFCKEYKNNYSLNFIDLFDENKNSLGTKVVLKIPII